MYIEGTILFYNEKNGIGIISVKDMGYIDFKVDEWCCYDVMPALDVDVTFNFINNTVTDINSIPLLSLLEKNIDVIQK